MKKHLGFLTSILAVSLLSGCSCGHQHTFSDEWKYDDTKHWHPATCEHTDVRGSEEDHKDENKNGVCDVCNYVLPGNWTDKEKEIFTNHLYGFKLPYIQNISASYDESIDSVILENKQSNLDSFNNYVSGLVSIGFEKQNGPYENTYILLKEVPYQNSIRTIEIDIYLQESTMTGVCYDPYLYEWPTELVGYYITEYFYPTPDVEIPVVNANRYSVSTETISGVEKLIIYSETKTNIENSYKDELLSSGFTSVSETRGEDGFFVAKDDKQLIILKYQYIESSGTFVVEFYPDTTGWPTFVVDYWTDQITGGSGTRVPAVYGAKNYTFYENSYTQHGYFFVGCETDYDLTKTYETSLKNSNYTLYNDAKNINGNYAALSENEDLLLQYLYFEVESLDHKSVYKEFDVLFEPYYPYNEEHVKEGLQIINEGTKTVLPQYPGIGEKITFSDTDVYMNIMIQSCTYASISEFINTLDEADWSIYETNPLIYSYEAISPDRDIKLETYIEDGRVYLKLSAHEDPYSEWPSEGVQEILDTLDLTGEVPVFEGAFGYDYENDAEWHDVVCFVKPGKEAELIEAYTSKLEGLGWKAKTDGYTVSYVKNGYTIALTPYAYNDGSGEVYIDIGYGDSDIYDIDARYDFAEWKVANDIDTNVQIPGIDITEPVVSYYCVGDEDETYEGYDLFEILVDIDDGDSSLTISEIINTFVLDGWEYSIEDGYYHNDILFMTSYVYKGYVAIDICAPIPKRDLLITMKNFVNELSSYYKEGISLPDEISISDDYILKIDTYKPNYPDLSMYVKFESYEKAINAKATIFSAFEAKGWVFIETKYSTTRYVSPNNTIELVIYQDTNSRELLVQFAEHSYW